MKHLEKQDRLIYNTVLREIGIPAPPKKYQTQYNGRLLEEEDLETPAAKQLIKDPYIFEFLGIIKDLPSSENDIETALINHIQHFMMELGKNELELKRLMEQDRVKFALDNMPE